MKPSTRSQYAARLEPVLQWLARHPQATPDLYRLAELACLSPFHFHRVYRALMGETVSDTAQRMRMQRAALELTRGQDDLSRVAQRAGYQSLASFTRAFSASYGAPPGRYRAQHLLKRSTRESVMYSVNLVSYPGLTLAALPHQGDYQRIGESFDRLALLAVNQGLIAPHAESGPWIGVYYDDPRQVETGRLRSHACVASKGAPGDPLQTLVIPAMRCGVVEYLGPYTEIDHAYDWMFSEWLPASGEEPLDFPMFEEYANDPKTTPAAALLTRIYLPLRA
ncbi:AraC family transcriptional regulator [Bordetella avium]|uniref:AraC-family transcriptional regulator n=1 Tax=Bordetella avium (strain 197N) TaxID=360910 RepID=Q2KTK1_BORA1|nr:AraC family transcriptional regulator [Bordetella avium]RIQ20088.1 AraC family transcriptional regulator [Bordetella avium]RIQ34668.1 AraC family transcriptional regulator [Bordetella avium]RIQ55841.1 AraC family transcriptional regulator [Bordetella avium]RIQ69898.1 AraC family transcriptional regulator [Bordetella avium]RIQ74174.1 AraC family transcriptional regulator [Bordetella avium]